MQGVQGAVVRQTRLKLSWKVNECKPLRAGGALPPRQGLTLVHYSAQLEPFLTRKHTLNTPATPQTNPKQPLTAPPVTQIKLS